MQNSNWKRILCAALIFSLSATVEIFAQGFGGGGFGGGGFGGGGGANRNRSTSTTTYNQNGSVGDAVISVDAAGHIIVIADDETMASVEQVLRSLDRPKPQVLIKVIFLEVQHSDALDIGIEGGWTKNNIFGSSGTGNVVNAFGASALGSVFGTTNQNMFGQAIGNFAPNPPGAGLYQILGTDFQATLRAIAQAGKAQLLSRPSILARDRQPANIVVGQSVPLPSSVSYVGVNGTPVTSVTYTDVGIILRVTPFITDDGYVQMILTPQISSIDPTASVTIAVGVTAPVINTRSADTVVITPDGQTVVIGGLMENRKGSSESKIPFLGDIPFLGNLFKRKTSSGHKTELLIFLTPHIVKRPSQLAAMSNNETSQTRLIYKSVSEKELDRFLENVPAEKEPAKNSQKAPVFKPLPEPR